MSNKNPVKRWYKWRYSGIITVLTGAILIYGGVMYMDTLGEFYDGWNCDLLIDYRDKNISTQGIPMYRDLPPEQQERYDEIIRSDCRFKP